MSIQAKHKFMNKCSFCGLPKEKHIKVLIRENGLGSKVIGVELKCPAFVGYYKEKKNGRQN